MQIVHKIRTPLHLSYYICIYKTLVQTHDFVVICIFYFIFPAALCGVKCALYRIRYIIFSPPAMSYRCYLSRHTAQRVPPPQTRNAHDPDDFESLFELGACSLVPARTMTSAMWKLKHINISCTTIKRAHARGHSLLARRRPNGAIRRWPGASRGGAPRVNGMRRTDGYIIILTRGRSRRRRMGGPP